MCPNHRLLFYTRMADLRLVSLPHIRLHGIFYFVVRLLRHRMTWMKHFDGVLAVANIRGGGEYGKEWHQAAIKQKRQNAL